MSEQEPLLPVSEHNASDAQQDVGPKLKERVAAFLEHRRTHQLVILLTLLDTAIVLADLSYTLLSPGCEPPSDENGPLWLDVLSYISLAITCFFFIEIPLTIWCFGWQHYNPFGKVPHRGLHFFDAAVIVTTLVLEFALRGKERELAELLIVLRLWRLVKVVEGVAVGTGEMQEESGAETEQLREEVQKLRDELSAMQQENMSLRTQLADLQGNTVS
ncbi:unnamed protein product [Peniophora sp. CBMAI 1063]|nr:unnamed protein product [Peniophora sp. CBMAI 1063]